MKKLLISILLVMVTFLTPAVKEGNVAILMIVSGNQVNEPYSYENDLICVFADDWQFTQNELDRFEFITVAGSVVDVEARLEQLKPVIGVAVMGNDGKLTFDFSSPNTGEEIEVWTNMVPPINWYRLVEPFYHFANIGILTAEEKQLLATIDINNPSVDSYIKKIIKDLSVNPLNNVVVKELKGDVFE